MFSSGFRLHAVWAASRVSVVGYDVRGTVIVFPSLSLAAYIGVELDVAEVLE